MWRINARNSAGVHGVWTLQRSESYGITIEKTFGKFEKLFTRNRELYSQLRVPVSYAIVCALKRALSHKRQSTEMTRIDPPRVR
jgi:hypothetical protein